MSKDNCPGLKDEKPPCKGISHYANISLVKKESMEGGDSDNQNKKTNEASFRPHFPTSFAESSSSTKNNSLREFSHNASFDCAPQESSKNHKSLQMAPWNAGRNKVEPSTTQFQKEARKGAEDSRKQQIKEETSVKLENSLFYSFRVLGKE